jgi:hypothetical protein
MRYVAAPMGSWRSLFWFMVGMAGAGFAGYVYLIPYQKALHAIGNRQFELSAERGATESATSEKEKLKSDLAKFTAAEKERSATEARQRAAIDALTGELKPALEGMGATVGTEGGAVQVRFVADKLIDANGIDVSDGGVAALKILAGAVKKEGAKVRVRARSSSAPPPKDLRSLFRTAGEMNAVRAARVMSALEGAGLAPSQVTIFGDVADKSGGGAASRPGRGKKGGAGGPPEHVEIEIVPV